MLDPGHSGGSLGLPRAVESGSLSHLAAARWTVAVLGPDENSTLFESCDFRQRKDSRCGSSDVLGLRTAGPHHSASIQLKIFGLCDVVIKFNEISNHA
jgi:hypothetical protein